MSDQKSESKSDPEVKKSDDMDIEAELGLDGRKPDSDVAESVDLAVANAKSINNVLQGVEAVLLIEKKQRQAENEVNTLYACKAILQMMYEAKNWPMLSEQISVICKRRSQFQRVVTKLVQIAMEWLDEISGENLNLLLTALLGVTEGKIYVECERARLTKRKAKIKEEEGDMAAAAKILGELQIETFGSMVRREKIEFLLEQMRYYLANQDLVRCGLIRNKITDKAIREDPTQEKRYWELSLRLFYLRDRQFLEMAKGYRRILELFLQAKEYVAQANNPKPTKKVDENKKEEKKLSKDEQKKALAKKQKEEKELIRKTEAYRVLLKEQGSEESAEKLRVESLANCIYTVCLAEHAPGQVTLINTLNQAGKASAIGKLMEKLPRLQQLVQKFCTHELISFPNDEKELAMSVFGPLKTMTLMGVNDDVENQPKELTTLIRKRVTQHNLRVMARYYVEVRADRLATLIGTSVEEMEAELSAMVTSGALWARIDRVAGLTRFSKKESPAAVLNSWRGNINNLLNLVNTVCHQIHKETMTAKA